MERRKKTLLLIAENDVRASDIRNLLAGDDLEIIECARPRPPRSARMRFPSGRRHRARLGVARGRGHRVHRSCAGEIALHVPPIVVSGSRELSEQQVAEIHHCARSGPVRYAPAIERVLDETVLLLHRKESALSTEQKRVLAEVRADRSDAGRAQGAGDRRRSAQHFRADQRSGTSRTEDPARRERPRRNRAVEEQRATSTSS